jgi:hypothetical protein
MKQKVLLALIALFSFVSAWAVNDPVVVNDNGTVGFAVYNGDALVAENLAVKVGETTYTGQVIYAADRETKVDAIEGMGNYFLKVTVGSTQKLFPFQVAVEAPTTSYEIIDGPDAWNASAGATHGGQGDGRGLKLYYDAVDDPDNTRSTKPSWEDMWCHETKRVPSVWNVENCEGTPVAENAENGADRGDGQWYQVDENGYWVLNGAQRCWAGAIKAAGATFPWIVFDFEGDETGASYKPVLVYRQETEPQGPGDGPAYEYLKATPWANGKFGNGEGLRLWGVASIPSEFNKPDWKINPEYWLVNYGPDPNSDELNPPIVFLGYEFIGDDTEFSANNLTVLLFPSDMPDVSYQNYDWTMTPTSKTYTGYAVNPTIKVTADGLEGNVEIPEEFSGATNWIVKYYTSYEYVDEDETDDVDGEWVLGGEVDAMVHAGTYYVQPYLAVPADNQDGYEVGDAIGDPKVFTIKKKMYLEINLAQVHMQYGDNEKTIEPLYSLSGFTGDDEADDFIIEGLGYVKRGPAYVGTDLVAGTVIQYTTTGIPHAYTGRTYTEDPETGAEVVDFQGYEDYEIRVLTNNAQLIADPGVVTVVINEDACFKTYGEKDPDFAAVYQNTDEEADYYTDDEDMVGQPVYWAAYDQNGNAINLVKNPITVTREKAPVYDEDGKLVSAEGEDVGVYDFYVTTTTNFFLEGFEEADAEPIFDPEDDEVVTNYKWTIEGTEAEGFRIDPFDISLDYAQEAVMAENAVYSFTSYGDEDGETEYATGTVEVTDITGDVATITVLTNSVDGFVGNEYTIDATEPNNTTKLRQLYVGDAAQEIWVTVALASEAVEAQDAYEEKFVIVAPEPEYNAETQFPDPKNITFKHEVLGLMQLMYETDEEGNPTTTPIKEFVQKWGTVTDDTTDPVKKSDGKYTTEYYEYTKATAGYNYADNTKGSYASKGVKEVSRDDLGQVYANGSITVKGLNNFTGEKKQAYQMNPHALPVKVKSSDAFEFAGATPNFGVELNGEDAIFAKETAANQTTILTNLGNAIWKYAPNNDYGYIYDGGTGENLSVGVKNDAKTASNVLLAAKNYAPVYTAGTNTIVPLVYAFKPSTQNLKYSDFVVEEAYTKPTITSTPITLYRPAITYTQDDFDDYVAANGEDPAWGVGDVKVEAVPGTVELASPATLPEGVTYDDLEALIQPLYAKINQNNVTKAGNNAGALSIDRAIDPETEAAVPNPVGYTITEQAGDLNIEPLAEIHLAYGEVDQALEDHKGLDNIKVYLPAREIYADSWYTMVLPVEFRAANLANDLFYGVIEVLDVNDNTKNYKFKEVVNGNVKANEPFIIKLASQAQDEQVAKTKAALAGFSVTGKIADEYKKNEDAEAVEVFYNDDTKWPFREDAYGNKFIGQYTGKTGLAPDEWAIATNPTSSNFGKFVYGGEKTTETYFEPTIAFLQNANNTPSSENNIRIYIEEDGVLTAIDGVEAGDEIEIAAQGAEGWYTITGVKLDAEPTTTGTYIFNGKKVFIQK